MTRCDQITTLWKACFQDTEEFIRFYFDRKYKDEDSLLYTENSIPLAASLMLPYSMAWQNTIVRTSYISGACTHPQARKRGIMTRLLQEGFQEMYNRGIAFTTLIPAEKWLYDFYARLGYATVFHRHTIQYTPSPIRQENECTVKIISHWDSTVISTTYSYFTRHMHSHPCHVIHSFDDYQDILTDLHMSNGCLAIAYSHAIPEQITGFALALPENDKITIKEIATDTPNIRNTLLDTLFAYCKLPIPSYPVLSPAPLPAKTHYHSQPFGMARIICLRPLLEHLTAQHPYLNLTFHVIDPILPGNQGTYILSQGHCEKTNTPAHQTELTAILTLTKYLLEYGNVQPHMSLMLE